MCIRDRPYFENISGKAFTSTSIFSSQPLILITIIAIVTILLSGIQPAFQLSAFSPSHALKGSQFQGVSGKGGLRKTLVVLQFVSSAALIICTIFMLRQMNFIQNTKLGYDKEHVITFRHNHDSPQLLVESLKGQPGIELSLIHI